MSRPCVIVTGRPKTYDAYDYVASLGTWGYSSQSGRPCSSSHSTARIGNTTDGLNSRSDPIFLPSYRSYQLVAVVLPEKLTPELSNVILVSLICQTLLCVEKLGDNNKSTVLINKFASAPPPAALYRQYCQFCVRQLP